MNIRQISTKIAKKHKVTAPEAALIISDFITEITEAVYKGHLVKLRGLATFKIEQSPATTRYDVTKKKVVDVPKQFKLQIIKSNSLTKRIKAKPVG